MISNTVDVVAVYRALGDNVRLGMVQKIAAAQAPIASCDVVASCASLLRLSQPSISHHFAKLVASGVVRESKSGAQKLYEVDHDVLRHDGVHLDTLHNQ